MSQNLLLSVRGGYFRTNQQSLGIPDQVQHVFVGTNEGLPGVAPDLVQPKGYADVFSNQATAFNLKTRGSLLTDTNEVIGTFTLSQGSPGRVVTCLLPLAGLNASGALKN